MIVRTNYQQQENKIYIYDELTTSSMQNDQVQERDQSSSQFQTYQSSEEDPLSYQESATSSQPSPDQNFYMQHKVKNGNLIQTHHNSNHYAVNSDIHPLYTIYEGGSSVSSGNRDSSSMHIHLTQTTSNYPRAQMGTFQRLHDNSPHPSLKEFGKTQQKILKTESEFQEYQQMVYNQTMQNQNHQNGYLFTQATPSDYTLGSPLFNGLSQPSTFVYEARLFQGTRTPLLQTQSIYGGGGNTSSQKSQYMFSSAERQVKCSSSRNRYDSVDDEEEEIHQEERVSKINVIQEQSMYRPSQKQNIKLEEYPSNFKLEADTVDLNEPTISSDSESNESEGDLALRTFPLNIRPPTSKQTHNHKASAIITSSEMSEVSALQTVLYNNLSQKTLFVPVGQEYKTALPIEQIKKMAQLALNSTPLVSQFSNTQSHLSRSPSQASTLKDEDSSFFEEHPTQQKNHTHAFATKQLIIQKAQQMMGDDEIDDINISTLGNNKSFDKVDIEQQDLEFRDPVTNEVFLRTSFQQAKRHLRKISQIMQTESLKQSTQSKTAGQTQTAATRHSLEEQGNTDDSEVPPDSERELIAGQRVSVIKSILCKMLVMQNGQSQRSAQWTQGEMKALTDIFKTIVHSEIEQKQQNTTSSTKQSLNELSKITELERQNQQMAREIQELKSQLIKSQKKKTTSSYLASSENTDQSQTASIAPCSSIHSRNISISSYSKYNTENNNTNRQQKPLAKKCKGQCSSKHFYKQCDSCGGVSKNLQKTNKSILIPDPLKLNFNVLNTNQPIILNSGKQTKTTTNVNSHRASFINGNSNASTHMGFNSVTSSSVKKRQQSITAGKKQVTQQKKSNVNSNLKVSSFLRH